MRTFHDDYPQNIQHTWQLAVWLGVKCKKYKLGFQTDLNILNMETRSNHYILVLILTFEKDASGHYYNPLLFDLDYSIHNPWPIDHLHNVKYSTYMRSAWWANQNIHLLYDHLARGSMTVKITFTRYENMYCARHTFNIFLQRRHWAGLVCYKKGRAGGGGLGENEVKTSWSRTLRSPSIWKLPTNMISSKTSSDRRLWVRIGLKTSVLGLFSRKRSFSCPKLDL
jgi:hypothetical protein